MTADDLVTLGRDLVAKREAADAAQGAFEARDAAEFAYSEACQAFLAALPDPVAPVVETPPVVPDVVPVEVAPVVPAPEPVGMPPAPVEESTDLAHPAV